MHNDDDGLINVEDGYTNKRTNRLRTAFNRNWARWRIYTSEFSLDESVPETLLRSAGLGLEFSAHPSPLARRSCFLSVSSLNNIDQKWTFQEARFLDHGFVDETKQGVCSRVGLRIDCVGWEFLPSPWCPHCSHAVFLGGDIVHFFTDKCVI